MSVLTGIKRILIVSMATALFLLSVDVLGQKETEALAAEDFVAPKDRELEDTPSAVPMVQKDPIFPQASPEAVSKWQDLKFGMFIHWGPSSILGGEISFSREAPDRKHGNPKGTVPIDVYDNLYRSFYPAQFNANEWVAIAKEAGAKYIVLVSRHHDGFSMYNSALSDYDMTSTPFKRDIVGEMAQACHEAGMVFGLYYSSPDWHHPDYLTENMGRFVKFMHGQVRELLSNYGKIDILWFDTAQETTINDLKMYDLFNVIRQLQPNIMINNRCGPAPHAAGKIGDFSTPEQRIGQFTPSGGRPWETCAVLTLNQWGWKFDSPLRSLKQCIEQLVLCSGSGGNYLLNVPPMPNGMIEPRQAERMRQIGDWLKKYGQSIYGTRPGPFKPSTFATKTWGSSTHKDNTIYLHITQWDGPSLKLPPINKKIIASEVLTGGSVDVKQDSNSVVVTIPVKDQQELDTIVKLQLDGPASEVPPCDLPRTALPLVSLTTGKKAIASHVSKNKIDTYGPEKCFDGDVNTIWMVDKGTHYATMEVDLGESVTFDKILISELEKFENILDFKIEYKNGNEWDSEWVIFLEGTNIGVNFIQKFKPITTRYVRLTISEATISFGLREFHLYAPDENKQ